MDVMKPFYVEINDLMLSRAKENAARIGKLKDSILKGEGNLAGCLVEEMYLLALPESIRSNTYGRDILYKSKRGEIKGKQQTVDRPPRPDWEASVALTSNHQKPDFYLFGRVYVTKQKEYPHGWLLGGLSFSDIVKVWRKVEAGALEGNNKWKCSAICYNILHEQLKPAKLKIDYDAYAKKEIKAFEKIKV